MTAFRLVSPATSGAEPAPDADQLRALDVVRTHDRAVVTGAPGTGKTTFVVHAAADAVVRGVSPDRLLVLASSRAAASELRDRVTRAIGTVTTAPLARTSASFAFSVLSARARQLGKPRPSLITGAEQDVRLREMLEGRALGRVAPLDWGPHIPIEATALPGFREELRNLLMRAAEADVQPPELEELGRAAGRPEWVAAARLYEEYLDIVTLEGMPLDQGERYDPATIVTRATEALRQWEVEVGTAQPGFDLVIVDDAQDATVATERLLAYLARAGTRVVLVGNADESVQGYRGAAPALLGGVAATAGTGHVELTQDHRQGAQLSRVSAAIATSIGVKGAGSARAVARRVATETAEADAPESARVLVMTAPHRYGQSRAIAAELRRARHGLDSPPVAWSKMAVIARSTATLRAIRSDLVGADIPCESGGDGVALHLEPAVAPLLAIVRHALGEHWDEEQAVEVLCSRVIGLDPVSLRRLRRELVREERAGGGNRSSGELLLDALDRPERWATLPGPEARAAHRLARAVRAAAKRAAEPFPAPGAVLWAVWHTLDLAETWRQAALAGSARDDADLDAVIALLRAAQTFTERLPEASAMTFLSYLEGQGFAADTLGAHASAHDAVSFATPTSALGREWEVVVIAGVEEGAWPNLALRDSVLGAQRLAEALRDGWPGAAERASGPADLRAARASVLDDETRAMLVAVSRARSRLIVTAVDDGESRPSRFMATIEAAAGVTRERAAERRSVADVRSAVAHLRAAAEEQPDDRPYAKMLAALANRGVQGAHPSQWHGAHELSTTEPFWEEDEPIRVSPSKVEWVEKCTLRWAFESVGGTREATDAQQVGTLIHALAELHPHGGATAILADFDRLWAEQFTVDTWPERVAYANARAMAERLAAYLDKRADVEVLTERPFRAELGRAVLSGIADRIERHDGGAYVVDLKTGRSVPSQADALENPQLAMYQLAIASGAVDGIDTPLGAELAYVSTGKAGTSRTQPPIDPDTARRRLDHVVGLMTGSVFPAVVDKHCDTCPVRRSCPAHAEGAQVSDT